MGSRLTAQFGFDWEDGRHRGCGKCCHRCLILSLSGAVWGSEVATTAERLRRAVPCLACSRSVGAASGRAFSSATSPWNFIKGFQGFCVFARGLGDSGPFVSMESRGEVE